MQVYRNMLPSQGPVVTVTLPSVFYNVMLKKPFALDCSVKTNTNRPIVLVPRAEDGKTVLVSESPVQVDTALNWFPDQANLTDNVFGRFLGENLVEKRSFYNEVLSKVIFSIHKGKCGCKLSRRARHRLP